MTHVEAQAARHARRQVGRPHGLTCIECHRNFWPKNEDQRLPGLCDRCFEAVRHTGEAVMSVHVHVLPHGPTVG